MSHQWDREGERCVKCGAKDWMEGPCSTPSETALSVPDGWKLVPVEPTADMIDAGGETPKMKIIDGYCSTAQLRGGFSEDRLAGPKSDCAIAQVYKAMLATAPSLAPSAIATPFCPNCHCSKCRPECHGLTEKQKEPI